MRRSCKRGGSRRGTTASSGNAAKAVEALKGWLKREGGVAWGWSHGQDFLQHDRGKIAWAQWVKLNPGATLRERMGFDAEVHRIVGGGYPGKPLGALKPADWRTVMNALGERVRAAAAGAGR